ncbi:MAG TPA: transcriptional regulator [Pseudolabrys sp.]|nr:transcriptional regulator [Pseudolabrys sp.]
MKLFSSLLLICTVLFPAAPVAAAELVMFEQAGCPWCAAFERDVAPAYAKSEEGLRAPLRRIDIGRPLPSDLSFIRVERLTPLFVLVEKSREIGRIRGYPGAEGFWMQLSVLFGKLDKDGVAAVRAHLIEK